MLPTGIGSLNPLGGPADSPLSPESPVPGGAGSLSDLDFDAFSRPLSPESPVPGGLNAFLDQGLSKILDLPDFGTQFKPDIDDVYPGLLSDTQEAINDTKAALSTRENELEQDPELSLSFDDRFQKYRQQLSQLSGSSARRPNIYDLATSVAEGIASSDPTRSPFGGIAKGLINYRKSANEAADKIRQEHKQIALTAFQMAKSDEDAAAKYMNEMQLKLIELSSKREYTRWAIPEVDEEGLPTGELRFEAVHEGDTERQRQLAAIGGYPFPVRGDTTSTTINTGNQGATEAGKKEGAAFSARTQQIAEEAAQARSVNNLLKNAYELGNNLTADDFGTFDKLTLGLKKLAMETGLYKGEEIADKELVKSMGLRIAMGLIGQTKGAISNAEMELFLAASPGLGMTKEGYQRLIGILYQINKRSVDLNRFLNQKLADPEFFGPTENDVSLNAKLKNLIDDWHDQNPLFTPEEEAELAALANNKLKYGSSGLTSRQVYLNRKAELDAKAQSEMQESEPVTTVRVTPGADIN